mmetsp:Transcript_42981/g.98735  ORF Transcript_42981/g.98735 Transcript_42981/m.98735 type:complete len:858 (+) Transcript_42981:110-2683(+)
MVDPDLNRLEDAMLEKVQQRTPPRMSEDTFLQKAFRFQDVMSTGYCDFAMFKKALVPFTTGMQDQILEQVFQRYAKNGALNYKTFASEFVSGVRRQAGLQTAEPQEASWETVDDTLARMKDYLYSRGPRGIMSLAAAFRDADEEGSRTLGAGVFVPLLIDFFAATECRITDEQAEMLFQTFRQAYAPGSIAYDELFLALRVEPSPERRACIRSAFRRLDSHSEGLVDMNVALDSFNAGRHPQVADGSRQADEVMAEFTDTLQDLVSFRRGQNNYPTNLVAWEEFEDYYKFINGCFESDALFCAILQRVWDLDKVDDITTTKGGKHALAPAAGLPPKSRTGLHHWQTNTLPQNMTYRKASSNLDLGGVMWRARQAIAQRGLCAAVEVVKSFYAVDDDVNDILDVFEFRRACKQSGLTFNGQEEQAIFEACGEGPAFTPKGIGKLKLLAFLELLHGTLSGVRLQAVQQAFRSLGGDPEDQGSTIPPTSLKERYAVEAHPRVVRGEVEAKVLLSEFLDTFSLLAHVRGGCLDGMVSFADFAAYYEVVASTIDNETYFDFLMRRLWSLPPSSLMPQEESQGGDDLLFSPRTGLKKVSTYNPRRDSPMASPRPPAHSGASAYAGENGQDGSMSHRRYLRKPAPAPGEAGTAACYSPITRSSITFQDTIPGPVQTMITSLREAIARRGLKGWLLLVQAMKKYDTKKNGTVTRLDWDRTNKLLGLGLSPEEREGLYRQYSAGRRDGAFNYEACLKQLKPPLTEVEQVSVSALYDALRDSDDGVFADSFKAAFDPVCTPMCMLKKKSPDQALQEFCDAVDYFCDEVITEEAMMSFFTMVKAYCEEDDEFHVMSTAAFGVSKQAWR